MLGFKAKYIKRKRGHRCNLIKKEKYKYILGESLQPYANLSLFLIISFKNYISHPKKILMKSAATMVFGRKVSQSSSFKEDFNLIQTFPLPCDVVVVLLHKLFSLIC